MNTIKTINKKLIKILSNITKTIKKDLYNGAETTRNKILYIND
jgi:hypothetical protein